MRPAPIRHPHDPGRFLWDFLPAEERLIRRDGIRMFNLHYWDNVLSPLAGRSQQRFIIKYDPRNLSRVYLRDEKGDYWTIPYRDLGAPPITLWEHRNALRKLSVDGLKSVDEKLIFQTIAAQRELIAVARLRTRSARLAQARSTAVIEVRIGRTYLRSAESERVLPYGHTSASPSTTGHDTRPRPSYSHHFARLPCSRQPSASPGFSRTAGFTTPAPMKP